VDNLGKTLTTKRESRKKRCW